MWEAFKLTVVILIDGHGGWLQDTNFEPLMDPKCDLFWFFVRNLQGRTKDITKRNQAGKQNVQPECFTLFR